MPVLDQLDALADDLDGIDARLDELPAWHTYHEGRIRAATEMLTELQDRRSAHAKTLDLIRSELETWRLDPYRRADARYSLLQQRAQEESDIVAANARMNEPRHELASARSAIKALEEERTALQERRRELMAQRTKLTNPDDRSYGKSQVSVGAKRATTPYDSAEMVGLTARFSRRVSLSSPQRSPSPAEPLPSKGKNHGRKSRGRVPIQQDQQSSPPVTRAASGQRAQKARSSSISRRNGSTATPMVRVGSRQPEPSRASPFEQGRRRTEKWLQGQNLESAGPVTLVTALIEGFGERQHDIPAFTQGRQQDLAAKARGFPDLSRTSRREASRVVIQAWASLIRMMQITFTFVGDRTTEPFLQGQQEAIQQLFVRIKRYRHL